MYSGYWALHLSLFAVAATFTPGPNALLLTSSAANFGLRAALPAALGVWLGIPSLIVAVGVGLGAIFTSVSILQLLLHVAATVYIAWLAWGILRMQPPQDAPGAARPLSVVQVAGLQWVNPKVWTMAVGAIGAYTTRGANPLGQALLVGAVFAAVCIPAVATWTLFGAAARRWLASPRRFLVFKSVMSTLLLVSVVLTWTTA